MENNLSRQRLHQKRTGYKTIKMEKRKELLNMLGNECKNCGTVEDVQIHHTDKDTKNNNINNLVVLCQRCHKQEHKRTNIIKGNTPVRTFRIDDDTWRYLIDLAIKEEKTISGLVRDIIINYKEMEGR